MSAEDNKRLVIEAYAALNAGDPAGYWARVSDDVRLTIPGTHRFARTFHGKVDVMENFVAPLRERLAGTLKIHLTNVLAEGSQVVVEGQGESRTRDGRDYNNRYCTFLEVRDGIIVEMRDYIDTELVKAIFG